MTDLRQIVHDAAKHQGVTQQQLAEAGGVSRQTVNNWLAGRSDLKAKSLGRIMDRLGMVVIGGLWCFWGDHP